MSPDIRSAHFQNRRSQSNPAQPNRQSIRLKGYDYAQPGSYFITLCTHQRAHLFGEIQQGRMVLNAFGHVADQCWRDMAVHCPDVVIDAYVIMPNHVHGIITIAGERHASPRQHRPAPQHALPRTIGSIIGGFKSATTKRINEMRQTPGGRLWQRNYYEIIIRDERAFYRIQKYIQNNPAKWQADRLR